jgi:hypothetical protein
MNPDGIVGVIYFTEAPSKACFRKVMRENK